MVTTYEIRGAQTQFSCSDGQVEPLSVPSIKDVLLSRGVEFIDNTTDLMGQYQAPHTSKQTSC